MRTFPKKAWMPFAISPSSALHMLLNARRFRQLRRRGVPRKEAIYQAEKYADSFNLPEYCEGRAVLSSQEWRAYQISGRLEKIATERKLAEKDNGNPFAEPGFYPLLVRNSKRLEDRKESFSQARMAGDLSALLSPI